MRGQWVNSCPVGAPGRRDAKAQGTFDMVAGSGASSGFSSGAGQAATASGEQYLPAPKRDSGDPQRVPSVVGLARRVRGDRRHVCSTAPHLFSWLATATTLTLCVTKCGTYRHWSRWEWEISTATPPRSAMRSHVEAACAAPVATVQALMCRCSPPCGSLS